MINIAERPQGADDRAVSGHWAGDLLVGKNNQTAIGTLVERTTGYALLVHLPEGYKPEQVAPALSRQLHTLPDTLRRSLAWDQRPEMLDCNEVSVAADIDIYFCDPHAPWQRGSNENTNGLLRQYFPKGTDLGTVSELELDGVAEELNDRPRKRLGFYKPTERLAELLLQWPLESAAGQGSERRLPHSDPSNRSQTRARCRIRALGVGTMHSYEDRIRTDYDRLFAASTVGRRTPGPPAPDRRPPRASQLHDPHAQAIPSVRRAPSAPSAHGDRRASAMTVAPSTRQPRPPPAVSIRNMPYRRPNHVARAEEFREGPSLAR